MLRPKSPQSTNNKGANTSTNGGPKTVAFSTAKEPFKYAGSAQYDACNFLPVEYLKTYIGQYDEAFTNIGTDKKVDQPLALEHSYLDRSLGNPLGTDGKAREATTAISETGTDRSVRAQSFMSIADSYCFYGQGKSFDSYFARAYIIQPPRPLHSQLTAYLDQLKKDGRLAIESQGVQVFVEPIKQGDNTMITIFRKGNTVVFISSRQETLVQAVSDHVVKVLSQPPAGAMLATYPGIYGKLTNSCDLLPANDFERLMGKPSSAYITETLFLTEFEAFTAKRECSRVEVERLKEGEISSVQTELTETRTEDQAKNNLETLKSDKHNSFNEIKKLGDEAYTVTNTLLPGSPRYSIIVRLGKVVLTIKSNGETKDASVGAFSARTLPVAQAIVKNYKR